MSYGVRLRKTPTGPFRRLRTLRNPSGTYRKAGAVFMLNVMRARGYRGHIFEILAPVVYPTATHYSEHFTRAELNCKCGCTPSPEVVRELTILAKDLEQLRFWTGPITVLSGHRCRARNLYVKGASNSQHLYGTAADLGVSKEEQKLYRGAALKVNDFLTGGIGVYPNGGFHVDHRGYVARWDSY